MRNQILGNPNFFAHSGLPPPPHTSTGDREILRNSIHSPCSLSDINRHQGAINLLFLDLSVSDVGLKGLWTLRWNLGFDTHGPWTKAGGVEPQDWPEWMRGFKDY